MGSTLPSAAFPSPTVKFNTPITAKGSIGVISAAPGSVSFFFMRVDFFLEKIFPTTLTRLPGTDRTARIKFFAKAKADVPALLPRGILIRMYAQVVITDTMAPGTK